MMGGLLSFTYPLALAGLALLPVIWWLLRVTPPRPETEIFPPLKILAKVLKNETTPRKTPWWLMLLRMLMATALIFAVADPIWNPVTRLASNSGPLAIIIDNGWTSQRIREAQIRTAESLIAEAAGNNKTIYIAATAQAPDALTGPFDADTALKALATIEPVAAIADRKSALTELASKLPKALTVAFLSDGITGENDADAFKALDIIKPASFLWFTPQDTPFAAIAAVNNEVEALEIEVARYGVNPAPFTVAAFDAKGRRIGEAIASFAPGALTTKTKLNAPFELRNDIQSLSIEGQRLAGSTFVIDDNLKRKRVALLSGSDADQSQPLLSPLYYIRKAIEPFADIVMPRSADIATGLSDVLESRPSVIVMADVGTIPEASSDSLTKWIDNGGVLIRFAGPRLAAAVEDKFLPVVLRTRERALGGSMSWTEPQTIAEFPVSSPFAALTIPIEVTVTRQVLAEPDPDLAAKTWASLQDGTPLVTAAKRGKGTVVLFHVTPQATWSNLPISGSFVDMLRQTIMIARGAAGGAASAAGASLTPWRIITPVGALGPATGSTNPLVISAAKASNATLENPPGLYGNEDGAVALNLLKTGTTFQAASPPVLVVPVEIRGFVSTENQSMKGAMLGLAALLLILDSLAMILLSRRQPLLRNAATALFFALFILPLIPNQSFAQSGDMRPGDAEAIAAISQTRLAFVKTGNDETDQIALEGLKGLTLFLRDKTALEPANPVGVDAEADELAFFPMLYWPVDPDAPMPSEKAIQRVDAYMQAGGSVLFDTRDQGGANFSLSEATSPANERLRAILDNTNIPPLEPVPADHVLTKSFYLLEEFPGRYDGSPLWIEQTLEAVSTADRPVRTGDGVSPILITGNDFASAWALTDDGMPLYPNESNDPQQRILALRSGVNIVMYMLTGNYKSDQVHIPSLLERLGQ